MDCTAEKILGRLYYEDGSLAYDGYFTEDEKWKVCRCGLGTQYYPDGTVYREGIFNRRGLLLGREYYPNGKLRYQLVLRENLGYGPNFPVCGIFYDDQGREVYTGKFTVWAGGVGYPVVKVPKNFGDVAKYDYRTIKGAMYREAPRHKVSPEAICCNEPDVTYNEWLKFLVHYLRRECWVAKMMRQGHITERHIITALVNENNQCSFKKRYQVRCEWYEVEKARLRRDGWTKQQYYEYYAYMIAEDMPDDWKLTYSKPKKIAGSQAIGPRPKIRLGKEKSDEKLLAFIKKEFELGQDELEQLTEEQADELYEYALACVLEEWPQADTQPSERLLLAGELMHYLGCNEAAACVQELLNAEMQKFREAAKV